MNKLLRSCIVFLVILGISLSSIPFNALSFLIDSYQKTSGVVDRIWLIEQDRSSDIVDKFNSYRDLAEGIKIQEAHAAASYIGNSNMIYTNGGATGAITPNASTLDGDLLVFYHYSRATGGNETVALPAGFNSVFNSVTANRGLVAVGWHIKQPGDGSFQAAITNHTAGTTGETVIEFIQTYRGTDTINPISDYTASLSNWASSLNMGPIVAPAVATINDGDMAVVFGGRFENITGQTVLSGDSLAWTVRTTANTTQGTDAGAVVQTGLNSTGVSQTVTSKTITSTGTAQAGAGRMFIIRMPSVVVPDAIGFTNNTEGILADGGRSSQQITVTSSGANFGSGPSDGVNNAVKIGTYAIPDGNIISWNATSIVFTVPAMATVYGGTGASGLIIRAGGNDDATPLDFYIYPNITSILPSSGQIGSTITISGDHLGLAAGTISINTRTATVGTWGEDNLLNVTIPGQEGAPNINGKIQITRSDAKISNLYPAGNFVILAPSISASNPATATTGQILAIEFTGQGIDTDLGTSPILKLTKTGQTDITGTSYAKVTDHQKVSANFDLSGAVTGWWNLVIINMDTQSGTRGDESTFGFYIGAPNPTVTGINPDFGLNSEIRNITSIVGTNFDSDAIARLTNSTYGTISTALAFTRTSATELSSGSFDLNGKNPSWWKVEVINVGAGTTGSYGDESTTGFEIRTAVPSIPSNLSQSKTELGSSVAEGSGIGGQITIYLRMEMEGGSADNYTPEVEVKPYSTPLDGLTNIYPGTPAYYDPAGGIPSKGSVLFTGTDGESYHWQARVRNSQGTSAWTSFGIAAGPNDKDFYLDNTPPSISFLGGDCLTATTNITDVSAVIGWVTFDGASGASVPLGPETSFTYPKIQYIETSLFDNWINPGYLFPPVPLWEDSPHSVNLSGLSPNTSYTFRIVSEDSIGNTGYSSANCPLSTESSFPIKTIELFILQESAQNSGSQISKPFSVYIPESPGTNSISVKSSFIEISGISSAGNQEIEAELQQNGNIYVPPGTTYSIDSTGVSTPFVILFDALDPAGNNQNMKNITDGGQSYNYTLYLNGNGTPISVFSAKLIITYTYKP